MIYGLGEIIREYDKDDEIKKAICKVICKNITEDIAFNALSEDLSIDDGSNIRIGFTEEIENILRLYFQSYKKDK
jgi:hypothetical protein